MNCCFGGELFIRLFNNLLLEFDSANIVQNNPKNCLTAANLLVMFCMENSEFFLLGLDIFQPFLRKVCADDQTFCSFRQPQTVSGKHWSVEKRLWSSKIKGIIELFQCLWLPNPISLMILVRSWRVSKLYQNSANRFAGKLLANICSDTAKLRL